VCPAFARQAAEIAAGRREPVLRVGSLEAQRDFLDVDDVIAAYLALLDRETPAGAYNVASGQARRIGDVLDALLALAGVSPRIEVDPARLRPADVAVGDASRLRAATGWAPRVPFELTLRRVLDDWRSRVASA
jgi:GDP-4-dehydro-6-deoxy-D-mannose reductase